VKVEEALIQLRPEFLNPVKSEAFDFYEEPVE